MMDTYADVPIGDLALGAVLASVTEAMARHRLKLPADLLLLIKAVATIDGVVARPYPSFRMVRHASPLVQLVVEKKHTPGAIALLAAHAGHAAFTSLLGLPRDIAEIVRKASTDGLQVQFVHRNFDHF